MSEFTWTTNDFELSEYLISNDDRTLPTALTEGEIIREIKNLEEQHAALKRGIAEHAEYDWEGNPINWCAGLLTAEEQEK